MTSLLVNILDENKANDVVCFLKDIPFLEIIPQSEQPVSQKSDILCETNKTQPSSELDFSKYGVDSFLGCDPLKYQKSIRDEWR
jgi:hypothetical protein